MKVSNIVVGAIVTIGLAGAPLIAAKAQTGAKTTIVDPIKSKDIKPLPVKDPPKKVLAPPAKPLPPKKP